MKSCSLLMFCILVSTSVHSQDVDVIRQNQRALAQAENVEIVTRDDGLLSLSRLEGVPAELAQIEVRNESDLLEIIDELYPYYGFSGSESLEYKDKMPMSSVTLYLFEEKINGLATPYEIRVEVDLSNRIRNFYGVLVMDRGFESTHILTEQAAVATALRYLVQRSKPHNPNGTHSAQLYYQAWGDEGGVAPWWRVRIDGAEYCFIAPNGEIDNISGVFSRP